MNTFAKKINPTTPSTINRQITSHNKSASMDKNLISSEKFIPVPYTNGDGTSLPIWQTRFEVLKSSSPVNFCLEINGDIVLGVENGDPGVLNLSKYCTNILGVSRRHLKISPTETDLLMIDLDSTNGTRKNGRLIQPNTPYSIFSGDILELGDLILAVNIVKAPSDQLILTEDTSNIVNALTHISTAITSNLDPDDVLDRILEMAVKLCKADEIALLLWDEQANELYLRAERGIGDNKTRLMKVPMKQEYQISEVLQTGKSSRNKMTNGHKSKVVTGYFVEAVLYAPIANGEDSIGVLMATQRDKVKEFSPDDERMLCTIGKFAAIAIQNSRKYEATNLKLQKKLEELSSYQKISHALSATNNLTGVYNALREQIRERWDVENFGLWLVDDSTKLLVPFPKPTFHKNYSFGEELIGEVALCAEPLLASDIKLFSEPSKSPEPTLQLLARSAACVPILENDKVLGVLAVFSKKENVFDNEDIKCLQTFSMAASSAIRNAWLFEQVERQRATILASVNMLPHPVIIVDQDGKIIVSNKAADSMLKEVHSSISGTQGPKAEGMMPLIALINGLSESKWSTKEIFIGEKVYVATVEYSSMVGTIIIMQNVTDPVTGSVNHRHFQFLADQAFQEAKRYNKPLAALIIGLNDLARIIAEKGHAHGNLILKELASQLRSCLRTPDILGRYENEQFIVILPETNLENAGVAAERITQRLSKKSNLTETYKVSPKLTIGISMLDFENDDNVNELMKKAYKAFTVAKQDKKCKVKTYEQIFAENCDGVDIIH